MVGGEHISGDVEEALNLTRVEVHGDIAIRAGDFHHLGDELGGDGHTRLVFSV